MPEHNIGKGRNYRSDAIGRASSSSYGESLIYSDSLEGDYTQCARAAKDDLEIDHLRSVYLQAEIESRFDVYEDVSGTQSTEMSVSQKSIEVLNRDPMIIRRRSSTEDSGTTNEENSARGGSGDESESSSTKRNSDELQRTPTRVKKVDTKGTPKISRDSQSNDQDDNSFVARFSPSRRDKDISQAEWTLTRRAEMVNRGTSPINL